VSTIVETRFRTAQPLFPEHINIRDVLCGGRMESWTATVGTPVAFRCARGPGVLGVRPARIAQPRDMADRDAH
jgi:acyl-CoA hydrolase